MSLSFGYPTQKKTYMILQNVDKKKTCQENYNPVKMIKSHEDMFSYFIHHNFNNSQHSSVFPQN